MTLAERQSQIIELEITIKEKPYLITTKQLARFSQNSQDFISFNQAKCQFVT